MTWDPYPPISEMTPAMREAIELVGRLSPEIEVDAGAARRERRNNGNDSD